MKLSKMALAVVMIVALFVPRLAAEVVDRVVAVVNDEPITQSELDTLLGPIFQQYKSVYSGNELNERMNDARIKILNQLIEDRLVLQKAKEMGIEVSDVEVDDKVQELKSRFPSEEDFDKLLQEQGLTFKQLRKRYEEQLMIRRLHQFEIRSRVVISPKEIQDYYEAHKEEFTIPQRAKIATIMIRKKKEDEPPVSVEGKEKDTQKKQEALALIQDIRKQLSEGASFSELAQKYSEESHAATGGEVGYITPGDLIEEFEQAIFSLEAGQTTAVLESPVAYHLFKVLERDDAKTKELEEARDEIQGILYREKSQERFEEWMNELKQKAFISVQ